MRKRQGKTSELHLVVPLAYTFQHVVSYSIAQGDIVNVITFDSHNDKAGTTYEGPWVTECQKDELLECYDGWEPEVRTLLEVSESSFLIAVVLFIFLFTAYRQTNQVGFACLKPTTLLREEQYSSHRRFSASPILSDR